MVSNHKSITVTGYVLAAATVISVLAFGGVEPSGFAPAQIAVVILAVIIFWRTGLPTISTVTSCIIGILVLIPLLQLIPLPRFLVALISPHRVTLADDLQSVVIFLPQRLALTVNSFETTSALLRLVCYLLVFLIAIRTYQLRGEQPNLVGMLIGLGIFEACYGIAQYLTGWQYIFFFKKVWYTSEATGTYINRNHYAGLLEMVLPFIVAGMLYRARLRTTNKRGFWRGLILSPQSSLSLRDSVLFSVLLVGLIFSLSRMGITAALFGISVTAVIVLLQGHRSALIALLLILLTTGAYASWIGLTPVVERFEVLGNQAALEQDRLPIWRDTLTLIGDFPLVGTGLGTYPWASLHYQSAMLNMRYEHAHHDYLETAADIGIPAAVLIWGGLWILLLKLVRKVPHLHRTNDKVLATGCAGAMAALLVHSLADFNLQIPANALIFSWIAGTGAALTQKMPSEISRSTSREL